MLLLYDLEGSVDLLLPLSISTELCVLIFDFGLCLNCANLSYTSLHGVSRDDCGDNYSRSATRGFLESEVKARPIFD